MQTTIYQRLAISAPRKNRFPLDAFLGMGIYSQPKTTGFAACVQIQFSHRWVNWESIRERWESISPRGRKLAEMDEQEGSRMCQQSALGSGSNSTVAQSVLGRLFGFRRAGLRHVKPAVTRA
ncbi:hypothetical protein Pan181_09180 [Aeoliella mucimassa]|uniref:Uncharacterized protein n=1 Tax=Aeoliella mucimassa TaxID=2527972 RepID=A0A518AJ29_9BACT|nr:hypothetical protein Pan181_09180 [Aeoliella mucimassa]